MYFEYGEKEINHLKAKDKKPAAVIDRVGEVRRAADTDLFSSVVHHIVGQQISTKAQQKIWNRLTNSTGKITLEAIDRMDAKELQSFGISFKKASYIKDFALKVSSGAFDINAVWQMPDEEAVAALSGLKGVGVWTAEMILLFCMQRPNVFSFGDLAILRGLRMVYRHKTIDRKLFEKYRKRFSPYGSTASLYLWAVAGGAIPEMKDVQARIGGK